MSDEELMVIAKIANKKKYRIGDAICNYGESGGTLYLIDKGSVQISIPIMRFDSKEESVSILREGDCFGELSFFDGKSHSAGATATEDTVLLEINHEDYDRIIKENLVVGFEMQKKIILKVINIVREMNTRYSYRPFIE